MKKFLSLLAIPFVTSLCDPPPVDQVDTPTPRIAAATESTVVRIDMGQRFRGSGVVVTPTGYIVTALINLPEYEFWKYRVTVGSDRIPGRIVAVDNKCGLALIKADRPLTKWAVFIAKPVPKELDPAVVVSYSDTDSNPPLLTRRQIAAEVGSIHQRAESTETLDLRDMMTVSLRGSTDRMHRGGSGVFLPKPDRFIGIVIGSTTHDQGEYDHSSSPVFVVPASVVATFMKKHGVTPKTN